MLNHAHVDKYLPLPRCPAAAVRLMERTLIWCASLTTPRPTTEDGDVKWWEIYQLLDLCRYSSSRDYIATGTIIEDRKLVRR